MDCAVRRSARDAGKSVTGIAPDVRMFSNMHVLSGRTAIESSNP
tara:strand:+ start:5382 stop:5513 length:132 start_codon:yes stop_codon:yes gene_type:complete